MKLSFVVLSIVASIVTIVHAFDPPHSYVPEGFMDEASQNHPSPFILYNSGQPSRAMAINASPMVQQAPCYFVLDEERLQNVLRSIDDPQLAEGAHVLLMDALQQEALHPRQKMLCELGLAKQFLFGFGVQIDPVKARQYCARGVISPYFTDDFVSIRRHYAIMLMTGVGGERDYQGAYQHFCLALLSPSMTPMEKTEVKFLVAVIAHSCVLPNLGLNDALRLYQQVCEDQMTATCKPWMYNEALSARMSILRTSMGNNH